MSARKQLDLDYLIATAREAGRAILQVYETDFQVARKADASPVTVADLRAHRIIVRRLRERYPGTPILSEESAQQAPYGVRKNWKEFWLVDPLDGTKEFIQRNGQFTVNIALVEGSRPLAGVVWAPALDLLYYGDVVRNAESGSFGATGTTAFKVEAGREPVRLPPRRARRKDRLVIVGSRSHPTGEMDAFVAEQRRKYKQVEFVAIGSSLKICVVAEGRADIYPRFGPTMEWDTAAAHAIANAAGRRVFRYGTEEELPYNKETLRNGWFVVL